MRISKKAEYALRAVLELALHAPADRGMRSNEIFRATGLPPKFLETTLNELRRAGLITSRRGPDGGHWLARDPAKLSVGSVLAAIDGPLSLPSSTGRSRATVADQCLTDLWRRLDEAIHGVVDHVTVDELRRQAEAGSAQDFVI
ncbi:MAG: Rrf2 family transcriptional regulator [Deltaproteobacteria bacterium]|nr:Rrf2 family transcriptional regulator [Deltaproteobacteria bacterium]